MCGVIALMAIFSESPVSHPILPTFFTVESRDSVAWFRSPNGSPIFSLGVNCVGKGGGPHDLNEVGPLYRYTDYYPNIDTWSKATIERLRAWNFNTIGSWSDEAVCKGQMAYTPVLLMGRSTGLPWTDIFSAGIDTEFDRMVREQVEPHRNDSNIIGWYPDNELGWYIESLFKAYIDAPAENATRRQLLRHLEDRYSSDFGALTNDFAPIHAGSFSELRAGGSLRLRPASKGRETIHVFGRILAERYYSLMHDTIRRYDSNHLIFGDRYAGYYPYCVADAAKRYVDVVATNGSFADTSDGFMPRFYLETLHRITGRPIIVSEFYAAAMDNQSGNKNSNTDAFAVVKTQAQRAVLAEQTLTYLASLPYVVGAHWFQFIDQPPAGRLDGEDFNFGLIDIHNRQYDLLTNTIAAAHARVPENHRNARLVGKPSTAPGIEVPKARLGASDGLAGWANRGAYIPYTSETSFADLYACETEEGIALMLRADDYMDASVYEDKKLPASDYMTWTFSFGDAASPVVVRFAAGVHAMVNDERVRLIHNDKGLRQVVIAVVPLAAIKSDAPVAFTCSVTGYAGYMRSTWQATLHRG